MKGFLIQDIQVGSLNHSKRDLDDEDESGTDGKQVRKRKAPINSGIVSTPVDRPAYLCNTSMNSRGTNAPMIATPRILVKNAENIFVVGFIVLPFNVFLNNTLKVSFTIPKIPFIPYDDCLLC